MRPALVSGIVSLLLPLASPGAARLSTKGYGASVPVLSNDIEAGRAANRRVEVVVVE